MAEHWFIAGANRGIGLEMARQLSRAGKRVTASVRDAGKQTVLAQMHVPSVVFDVRDAAAMRAATEGVGALDVLVANAGAAGPTRQSPLDFDFDGALDLFSINTLGPLRLAQAMLPMLRGAQRPRIVFMSSIMGSMAFSGSRSLAYRASKAALNKIMQGLAHDLKAEGVTVVALHPGWARTDMGGPAAPVSVEDSAAGLIRVIDGLTPDDNGGFFDYQDERLDF